MKSAYDGFVTFKKSNRKMFIEMKDFSKEFIGEDGLGYKFDSVCRFTCDLSTWMVSQSRFPKNVRMNPEFWSMFVLRKIAKHYTKKESFINKCDLNEIR